MDDGQFLWPEGDEQLFEVNTESSINAHLSFRPRDWYPRIDQACRRDSCGPCGALSPQEERRLVEGLRLIMEVGSLSRI